MFKKLLYKTLLVTSLVVTATSCNKYLELRPTDGITRDKFWQSKEQIQSAVIGCYTAMQTGGTGRTPAELFFIWGELRGDMISPGIGMSIDENNVVNVSILSTNTVTDWRNIYRVINFCNNVLDFAPGVKALDNTLTQEQLNAYLSEALTLRALMYFYLVRSFGDVPLKLKSTSSDSELVQLAKSSKEDVLKQIVADLKLAESYAINTYGDLVSDKGRVTRYTVNALQADVYLWMDNYTESITAADKIINSGKFALVPGTNNNTWFSTLYGTGNSVEGIFELQFDTQILNPYFPMFTTTRRRYLAGPSVLEDVFTIDPNNENNFDIRGIGTSIRTGDQSIYKYIGIDVENARTQDVSYAHWIFYRYADILLLKAEACANSGRGQDALAIIDQIRLRAHAISYSAQTVSPDDVRGLTDYILAERAREMAYEGKRWYDLLRNAKRNNYARIDILTQAAVVSVPGNVQQSAISKLKDPNSHYFPINQYEIQTDPNLIQNPFYK